MTNNKQNQNEKRENNPGGQTQTRQSGKQAQPQKPRQK